MGRLTFIQLCSENKDECAIFEQMMWRYTKELDGHRNRTTSADLIAKWIKSIIHIQGDSDRHLELCYDGSTPVGFLYGKVDRPEHKGFIKVGYGYIMEFFVLQEHRRRGYGREMYLRLEQLFKMNITTNFNIVSLADDFNHLVFICDLLANPSNALALHFNRIPDNEYRQFYKEMRDSLIFSAADDELNYIIRKGVVPIAWLKLNGLSDDSLWISMLVVHEKYRRLGVGIFALNFVDEFARSTGRHHIYLHTTADNYAAQALYKSAGYTVTAEKEQQYGDGSTLRQYTLHKLL